MLIADPAMIAIAAVFGLVVGSFLNVVIYRLPVMMEREWRDGCREVLETELATLRDADAAGGSAAATDAAAVDAAAKAVPERFDLVRPRSRCPSCGHAIRAVENIPVISYLLLRGRCSACKASISLRYPIVELTTGLLSAVVIWHFGATAAGALAVLLTWALIALALIDADTQLLPDSITLPFLWIGLTANLFGTFTSLESAVIGAMAGYLSLRVIYEAFKILTGKEGMGFGDFKLLAMLGAWLGWEQLPVIVLLSSVVGAVVGIALMLFRGHERQVPIPFGPYLAAAGWLAALWGSDLSGYYLDRIGS